MNRAEQHKTHRIGWLRAAARGVDGGIALAASLLLGVASAPAPKPIRVADVAGVAAKVTSMATGECVSVSSQSDTGGADLECARKELVAEPRREQKELEAIHVKRGLDPDITSKVATQ